MRSLSLESILVNKNMKLLILLVTLLVQTNSSLSMPTNLGLDPETISIFDEMLDQFKDLEAELEAFNHSVRVQTPHGIKNVCECEKAFVQHLKAALMSVKKVLRMNETDAPMEIIQNILDNLNNPVLHKLKNSSVSCTFTDKKIAYTELLTEPNTRFIQSWISRCASKKN